jgi:hypothetical protein
MTLGIMGLDKVGLEIVSKASDSEKERAHARRLIPIREKGNWLLCTLLIANTVANTFLPILIASFAGGVVAFVVSTVLTLVLAEILPQAICSRYGLVLAAHTTYIIWALMFLLAPIAWPLSWLLDKALGREVGTMYSRAELKHLITIHVENPEHREESGRACGRGGWCAGVGRGPARALRPLPFPPLPPSVTREDYKVLSGALDIRDKRVRGMEGERWGRGRRQKQNAKQRPTSPPSPPPRRSGT